VTSDDGWTKTYIINSAYSVTVQSSYMTCRRCRLPPLFVVEVCSHTHDARHTTVYSQLRQGFVTRARRSFASATVRVMRWIQTDTRSVCTLRSLPAIKLTSDRSECSIPIWWCETVSAAAVHSFTHSQ